MIRTGRPNAAHHALAELERQGRVSLLVTQNVDELHRQAGSRALIELHGRLSKVTCLSCQARIERDQLQSELTSLNADWKPEVLEFRPDGDAELDEMAYPGFRTADCRQCARPDPWACRSRQSTTAARAPTICSISRLVGIA